MINLSNLCKLMEEPLMKQRQSPDKHKSISSSVAKDLAMAICGAINTRLRA